VLSTHLPGPRFAVTGSWASLRLSRERAHYGLSQRPGGPPITDSRKALYVNGIEARRPEENLNLTARVSAGPGALRVIRDDFGERPERAAARHCVPKPEPVVRTA
jgi:hypothetical protein